MAASEPTVGAVLVTDALIYVSTNGTTWEEISGSTNKVEVGEQERAAGEAHSLRGDVPIMGAGKRGGIDLAFTIIYTEEADEAWDVVRQAHQTPGGKLYAKYYPSGDESAGSVVYATAFRDVLGEGEDLDDVKTPGFITRAKFPGADAGGPGPHLLTFTLRTPALVKDVIPTPP